MLQAVVAILDEQMITFVCDVLSSAKSAMHNEEGQMWSSRSKQRNQNVAYRPTVHGVFYRRFFKYLIPKKILKVPAVRSITPEALNTCHLNSGCKH